MTDEEQIPEPTPQPDQAPDVLYENAEWHWRQLTPSPSNVRGTIEPESVRELSDSIVARGLLQAIHVHPDGEIIYGHRRYVAICLAISEGDLADDWPIDVVIHSDADGNRIDEGNTTIDRLVENLMREDLDPIEEARAMQSAVQYGFTQDQLAQHIGVNKSHVSKRIALLGLHVDVQNQVCKGSLTLEHALTIAKLPVERQPSFVNKPSYAVEEALKKDKVKAAAKALREQLKALGHEVAGATGKADEGKMWVQVGSGGGVLASKFKGSVPKTTQLIVVSVPSYGTEPTLTFHKQVTAPTEPVQHWENKTEEGLAKRDERHQAEAEREHRRRHVDEAKARVLLAQAKKLNKAAFLALLWEAEMEALVNASWFSSRIGGVVAELAKIKPEPDEKPEHAVLRVLKDEATPEATKARILIASEILDPGAGLEEAVLKRGGFDIDAVEIPPMVPAEDEVIEPTAEEQEDLEENYLDEDGNFGDEEA
jgi:ParB/RepB/Spo0J family partition protein